MEEKMGYEMLFTPRKQEKTNNFAQTCNRFSQFLKERRSFGHVDDLTNVCGVSKNMENENISLELFPVLSSPTAANVENSINNMIHSSEFPESKEEHKNSSTNTSSMTIFYGGKVLVFDELPQDKALEIMSLASSGTSNFRTQSQIQTQTQVQIQTQISQEALSSLSDLPIARRVSLHRFMEKRKHRIATSAPYQLHYSTLQISNNSQKNNIMTSLYEKQQLELKL